jgi:membrane protein DedA with SNARE-associated domain
MWRGLIGWYLHALDRAGYWLVAALMALESSIVPVPSELVVPPAAHLAATRGNMTVAGVVVAATAGSWLGATIMYWLARALGRPLLVRYGAPFGISARRIAAAESWSRRFGPYGVFAARLLPVIRHLIGIPAGLLRMDFRWYSVVTVAGSGIWCSVLAWVGVKAGQDPELMRGSLSHLTLWIGGGLVVLGVLYYLLVHRYFRPSSPAAQ